MSTPPAKAFKLKPYVVPEHVEQAHLARWLDFRGVLFCHVGNGEARSPAAGAKLKRMGVKSGVPDLLIFTPPKDPDAHWRGVAIELKTKSGTVSGNQKAWLRRLEDSGWLVRVCRGSQDAIHWLQSLGF